MVLHPGQHRWSHLPWLFGGPVAAGHAAPSTSRSTWSRLQAAAYWATHPASRTMFVIVLVTALVTIPLAAWTPRLFGVVAPAMLPLLGLIVLGLALVAAGQDRDAGA